jgi:hypothetical protein
LRRTLQDSVGNSTTLLRDEKYYPKNIVVENTIYGGKNAFVFGKPATEWLEVTPNYLLGFDDIENYYYERQNEEEMRGFEDFLNDLRMSYQFDKEEVMDWLMENRGGYYSVTTQGLDFSTEDLIDELEDQALISKSKEYAKGGETRMARDGMKVTRDMGDYYEVYDDNSGKTLFIFALTEKEAEEISEEIDFDAFDDGDYISGYEVDTSEDEKYHYNEKRFFFMFKQIGEEDSFAHAQSWGYDYDDAEEMFNFKEIIATIDKT